MRSFRALSSILKIYHWTNHRLLQQNSLKNKKWQRLVIVTIYNYIYIYIVWESLVRRLDFRRLWLHFEMCGLIMAPSYNYNLKLCDPVLIFDNPFSCKLILQQVIKSWKHRHEKDSEYWYFKSYFGIWLADQLQLSEPRRS